MKYIDPADSKLAELYTNQWSRNSRKKDGGVEIMYNSERTTEGKAFEVSLARQFLDGDWSFYSTIGKWS